MSDSIRQYFAAPAIGGPHDGRCLVHTESVLSVFTSLGRFAGSYAFCFNVKLPGGSQGNRWLWCPLIRLSA